MHQGRREIFNNPEATRRSATSGKLRTGMEKEGSSPRSSGVTSAAKRRAGGGRRTSCLGREESRRGR